MTTLKSPNKKEDEIKSEDLIRIGKRLNEIREEIIEITSKYGIHTQYNPFSESVEEFRDDIINTLGRRSIDGKH